jgi:branched-chain amino acid aminotransferase
VPAEAKNFHWGDMTRALFEAADAGGDLPVLLDNQGNVTEGPGFNVFCVTNGIAATPDKNVLKGITRLSTIELCREMVIECQLRAVPVGELYCSDEVFITSTAGGIMPIVRVDNRILGNGRPGPIFDKLHDLYWAKRCAGWHSEPVAYPS